MLTCEYARPEWLTKEGWGLNGSATPSALRTHLSLHVNLISNRKDCEALVEESQARQQPANAVEGLLYWARFVALERGRSEAESAIPELLIQVRAHLQRAKSVRPSTHRWVTKKRQPCTKRCRKISVVQDIGITAQTGILSRLESAACRWRHLNARSVILLSGVNIMRLLRESHERRTWRHNLVNRQSGFKISCSLYNFATDASWYFVHGDCSEIVPFKMNPSVYIYT